MESSDTPPQPVPAESKPIGAVPFEVVRQAEFVFEPFLGSLIQLPEARMQRAQSSEFFLPQSSLQPGKADVEEPLVWGRPLAPAQASSPAVPTAEETHAAISPVSRKAKNKKAAKEQEGPRFYQPPTVRFFDPLAAAAEDGEGEQDPELPEPRESTQLSPELKAAILRIDEQRRQMQEDEKQEKPRGKKKRGFLPAKPAARADAHDAPMEIVKPRDVVLTERAARWEEIAAPQPRPAEAEVPADPGMSEDSEVLSPAVEVVPPPAMATSAAADVEEAGAVSPAIAPSPELPPISAVAAHAIASTPEAVPAQEAISVHAPVAPQQEAQPQEIISDLAPEMAEAEASVSAAESDLNLESLREPEVVPVEDLAYADDAVPMDAPVDASVAPPLAAQPPEIFPASAQEEAAADEIVATPEFASPRETLHEPEIVPQHQAAFAHDDLHTDTLFAPPISAQPEETIPAAQEGFVGEEIVSTLEFSLSDEDLREPESATMPEAASPPAPTPAMPRPSVAPVVEPERISLQPVARLKETAPLPPAFAAETFTTTPVEAEPAVSPSKKRFRGVAAAVARGKQAQPVMEPAQPSISQTPHDEPLREEAEPSRKKKGKLPFSTRLGQWLGGESKLDGNRRRADRTTMPGLVAFYWSGGSPQPHEIVNISKTGFYLKTKEFWSIETLVRMTIQRPPSETKPRAESISVLARVVRIDEDGVGHEFVTTEALMHARSMDVMPSQGTDTRELDKFLHIK